MRERTEAFPAIIPMQKPDRPLSAAMARLYDEWNPHEDRGNLFYSNFKYSCVTGIGEEAGVLRRDPSTVIKVNGLYYAPDGLNFEVKSLIQIPPLAPGPFCPDLFAGNGDGRGIPWGLCHLLPHGFGLEGGWFIARFDCDLSKDIDRPAFKKNNLRFEAETYFQRITVLPDEWKAKILAEQPEQDQETM